MFVSSPDWLWLLSSNFIPFWSEKVFCMISVLLVYSDLSGPDPWLSLEKVLCALCWPCGQWLPGGQFCLCPWGLVGAWKSVFMSDGPAWIPEHSFRYVQKSSRVVQEGTGEDARDSGKMRQEQEGRAWPQFIQIENWPRCFLRLEEIWPWMTADNSCCKIDISIWVENPTPE